MDLKSLACCLRSPSRHSGTDPLTVNAKINSLNLDTWLPPEQFRPNAELLGPVDARGADWRGLSLGELDLTGSNLCRVDLRGADLSRCMLTDADLRLAIYDSETKSPETFDLRTTGAIGPGAKLSGAFLNSTDLREVDLRGAVLMGAYLSGADLSGALLDGVRLVGSDLRKAVLRGASCRGTRFGTCQLDAADFRGADMTDASLETAESIKGADFSLTTGMGTQRDSLLTRPFEELDCWNPLTRNTTRESLESLD